jgi:hypothetical protein
LLKHQRRAFASLANGFWRILANQGNSFADRLSAALFYRIGSMPPATTNHELR